MRPEQEDVHPPGGQTTEEVGQSVGDRGAEGEQDRGHRCGPSPRMRRADADGGTGCACRAASGGHPPRTCRESPSTRATSDAATSSGGPVDGELPPVSTPSSTARRDQGAPAARDLRGLRAQLGRRATPPASTRIQSSQPSRRRSSSIEMPSRMNRSIRRQGSSSRVDRTAAAVPARRRPRRAAPRARARSRVPKAYCRRADRYTGGRRRRRRTAARRSRARRPPRVRPAAARRGRAPAGALCA